MDHDKPNPPSGQDTDPTTAQNRQSPQGQTQQQPGQPDDGSAGETAGASDTITQQRSDIEGGTATGQASDVEGSSQFLGAQSGTDTSSELFEDDESSDFAKDAQGAPD